MIVDSSAIVAILLEEPHGDRCLDLLTTNPGARMSAATYLETSIVVDSRQWPDTPDPLDFTLNRAGIIVVPFTPEQARLARRAYQRYGKGSGHRARLNFGDCFAYALSVHSGEPLLFVGEDFTHTDVLPALPN